VNDPPRDINDDGVVDVIDELQARADLANAVNAVVLLSLHFNGLPGTSLGGAGAYYNAKRDFSDDNKRLAELVQRAQLEALASLGYQARDWGVLPDDIFETPTQAKIDTGYRHNTLIGPAGPYRTRPTRMPGVIAEPLFLTNRREAELAVRPETRDALARGYARAVREFLNPAPPDTGAPARAIERGQTRELVVALTLDAGAGTGATAAILETLRARRVRATFGLTGQWVEQNAALARRIVGDGHAIMNHSYSHRSWTGRSPRTAPLTLDERRAEVQRAERILEDVVGSAGRPLFRSPYGDHDEATQRLLGELGYHANVLWSFDSFAWRGARADDIISRGLRAAAPGAIYLFHVADQQDALALGPLIDALAGQGYRFVTVPELLQLAP
jgi:peptidoglycan-N-acetylglucosamine deacetylase